MPASKAVALTPRTRPPSAPAANVDVGHIMSMEMLCGVAQHRVQA